jgi:hypothetical protein
VFCRKILATCSFLLYSVIYSIAILSHAMLSAVWQSCFCRAILYMSLSASLMCGCYLISIVMHKSLSPNINLWHIQKKVCLLTLSNFHMRAIQMQDDILSRAVQTYNGKNWKKIGTFYGLIQTCARLCSNATSLLFMIVFSLHHNFSYLC